MARLYRRQLYEEQFQGQSSAGDGEDRGLYGLEAGGRGAPGEPLDQTTAQLVLFFLFVVLFSIFFAGVREPAALRVDHGPGEEAGPAAGEDPQARRSDVGAPRCGRPRQRWST
ncbi:MAG: hypothetical protein V8R55_04315 [Dysosmobacter sp.]